MGSRLVALALGLGLAACTLPPPRMATDEGSAREIAPVSRLGRWDGVAFRALDPGSLPASHLRVLVHGWTPGWPRRARPGAEGPLRGWELATDPEEPFEPWMASLARVLAAADPHAIVLAYSWVDGSGTGRVPLAERRALSRTTLHGHLLAEALRAALSDSFAAEHGRAHLIGHSYGGRVAAVAAADLGPLAAQLTLFDAPDAPLVGVTGSATGMASLLSELDLGWGDGRTFVDNYVSMVGRRYGSDERVGPVVDVALAPPFGSLAYRPRHVYPMSFYERTPGTGFGLDWSPLSPGARRPEAGCYEQRSTDELALVVGCTGL